MATVSKELAMKIIHANGYYSDDPRVQQVITYENAYGGISYALLYDHDVASNRYAPSRFIVHPTVIWEATDANT